MTCVIFSTATDKIECYNKSVTRHFITTATDRKFKCNTVLVAMDTLLAQLVSIACCRVYPSLPIIEY